MTPSRTLLGAIVLTSIILSAPPAARAVIVRGIGTGALIGGDLTDPENDGDPEANVGYNATFASSEEPGFGGAESAFNVFDNQVGGGNMKWCCGDMNNFPTNPISIDATFAAPFVLQRFTLTSGNDSPDRDPRVWQIQGTNDGSNFTTIFSQNDPVASVWTERDQVLEFDAGTDFATPAPFSTLRFITTATGATTGARFQLGEIEYSNQIPEPSSLLLIATAVATIGGFSRRRPSPAVAA